MLKTINAFKCFTINTEGISLELKIFKEGSFILLIKFKYERKSVLKLTLLILLISLTYRVI